LEIRGHQTSPVFRSALGRLRPAPAGAEPGERGWDSAGSPVRGSPRSQPRGAPLSRWASRSASRVRTARLEAERRPPHWRRGSLPRPRGGVQGEPGRRQRPAVARSAEHRGGPGSRSPPPPDRHRPRMTAGAASTSSAPSLANRSRCSTTDGSCSRARNLSRSPSARRRAPLEPPTPRFPPPADPGRGADPQRTRDGERARPEPVTGWTPCSRSHCFKFTVVSYSHNSGDS